MADVACPADGQGVEHRLQVCRVPGLEILDGEELRAVYPGEHYLQGAECAWKPTWFADPGMVQMKHVGEWVKRQGSLDHAFGLDKRCVPRMAVRAELQI